MTILSMGEESVVVAVAVAVVTVDGWTDGTL